MRIEIVILLIVNEILGVYPVLRWRKGNEGLRIIGGAFADHRNYPYIVSIQIFHYEWSHSCAGSVLTPWVILTACHCLYIQAYPLQLRHPDFTRIVAGTGRLDYWNGPFRFQQQAKAKKFHAHPNCGRNPATTPASFYHDVGVILLKSKLKYTPEVQPMKVYSTNPGTAFAELQRLQRERAVCDSPGWGLISTNPDVTTLKLKVAHKNLLTSGQCRKALCPKDSTLCATDFDAADQVCAVGLNSSVCNGDSGGPFVCNGFVFGVVSYGLYCGIRVPQIFSSIRPILYFYKYYREK